VVRSVRRADQERDDDNEQGEAEQHRDTEAACHWNEIHDLLPEWWQVGPAAFDPGRQRWSVTARSPKYGGWLRPPATITGEGEDEVAALSTGAAAP
jgi:hypothetical protein